MCSTCCGVSFGLRPNFTPPRRASFTPARVRGSRRQRRLAAFVDSGLLCKCNPLPLPLPDHRPLKLSHGPQHTQRQVRRKGSGGHACEDLSALSACRDYSSGNLADDCVWLCQNHLLLEHDKAPTFRPWNEARDCFCSIRTHLSHFPRCQTRLFHHVYRFSSSNFRGTRF